MPMDMHLSDMSNKTMTFWKKLQKNKVGFSHSVVADMLVVHTVFSPGHMSLKLHAFQITGITVYNFFLIKLSLYEIVDFY